MQHEKLWMGDPAKENGLDKNRENHAEMEQSANNLLARYKENMATGAFERGVATEGLVGAIKNELGGQDIDKNRIKEFSESYSVSPNLTSLLLKKMNQLHH